MLYTGISLLDFIQERPWFRSSMWMVTVAAASKIICTSVVAGATHTYVSWTFCGTPFLVLKRWVKVGQSPAFHG